MKNKLIDKIVFYADGELLDESALAYSAMIASSMNASLMVVSVVKPVPQQVFVHRGELNLQELQQLMVEDRRQELEQAVGDAVDADIDVAVDILVGTPATALIRAVLRDGYDMVIKAHAPASGMRRRLFGSTDDRLMRACPSVVAVLGDAKGKTPRRAIAALDYEPASETKAELNKSILEACVESVTGLPTEFHVVHAWSLYGETLLAAGRGRIPADRYREVLEGERQKREQWLESLVSDFRASLDEELASRFDPQLEVVHGDPVNVIPTRAEELDAQFLVIGTVSRTGAAGLVIGNTVEEILQRVDCSVITVKPEGFVSPVRPE